MTHIYVPYIFGWVGYLVYPMKLLEELCPLYQTITVTARVRMGLFLCKCYFNGKVICRTQFRISGDVNRTSLSPPPKKRRIISIVCRTQFSISGDVNRIIYTKAFHLVFLYSISLYVNTRTISINFIVSPGLHDERWKCEGNVWQLNRIIVLDFFYLILLNVSLSLFWDLCSI
jgi:hypothetical protein